MARILAVDDRAINREFLATLLGYAGHEVLQAADGAQALELVRRERPDLVITDVLMPVMDGVQFADRVHEDPSIAHTPILFYTATYRLPEAKVLADTCRVLGVLAKPAEPQEILRAVNAALGQEVPHLDLPAPAPRLAERGAKLPQYLRELARRGKHGHDHEGGVPATDAFHALNLRLSTLLEFDLALASERSAQGMVELFCSASQDIVGARYAAVGILDNEGRALQFRACRGFDAGGAAAFAQMGLPDGLFATVIATDRPQVLHDAAGLAPELGLGGLHAPVTSMLVVPVPVRSATSVHGWLYLAGRLGAERFLGEDEQFAITLAMQFALTFGNLVLYDEIQHHAAKLEVEVRERRRTEADLAHRIDHDQTTGLPRFGPVEAALPALFAEARARGRRVLVLYVDIDRFHSINETRGREAGDNVLRVIGNRLSSQIAPDGLLAHIAADEFACVVPAARQTPSALDVAESLRRCIEKPIALAGQRLYVTASVGVSAFPEQGDSPQALLRHAEAAMLRAKREGRNGVAVFSNEQRQELDERRALGLRLPDALRAGQFTLHYQPQVNAADGQIAGFEALVRWQDPELGLLPPARFLGIAEELGLTVDIGSFVLESACRQIRSWIDAGAEDFSVAVNVSSLQLQRPDFVDGVRAMLLGWKVPARHLEIELTENMMIGNVQRAFDTMRALKALGLKLALDDFGTGYSSLTYLRQFPIDTLKIDQSFVRGIGSDTSATGICRAVVSLGHQLGMTVLAEGVETAAQVGYLRRAGCDRFQGFYFSTPVSAESALELLEQRYIEREDPLAQSAARSLLLLDDEENILSALKRALRRDGYRILTATSSEQALDVLAREDVQVILSDQRLPGVNGTEFLSRVKEMYPDTVRMMLSGYTDLDAVTQAINRGAIYKFLMKPWNDDDLRREIQEAFRTYKLRMDAKGVKG